MIWDCIHFFNEVDIVDLRFQKLENVASKFLILEGDKTHQNVSKHYNFPLNKFKEKYGDKILYFPVHLKETTKWGLENENRRLIFEKLLEIGAKDDDLIFFSDADEIWNSSVLNNDKIKNLKSPVGLTQMNFVFNDKFWCNTCTVGTICAKFGNLKSINKISGDCLNYLRDRRNFIPRIGNGGRHYSYSGNINTIMQKCSAIAEGNLDYNTEDGKQKLLQYINDASLGKPFSFAPYGITDITNFPSVSELNYRTVYQNQWMQERGNFSVR